MEIDTKSNCSGISNQSDDFKSDVSTLSELSVYQEEFAELRHFINPKKYPVPVHIRSTTKEDCGCPLRYQDSVSDLSGQLNKTHQLNEKYQGDLYNLEKNIELRFHAKIEKLLQNNSCLKLELDNANEQIKRLIEKFAITESSNSMLEDKNFLQLEQKYHEVCIQNSALEYKFTQSQNQQEECELENKQLKIELNELKIDIEAKAACIKELKAKISQQHVEIQNILNSNAIYSQSLSETSSELEHVKKLLGWYKEQLQLCQANKKVLSDEVLNCRSDLSLLNQNQEKLNVELSVWKNKYEMLQLEALKDKEKLYKQLDNLNFLNVPIKAENTEPDLNTAVENKIIANYYETSIQDLTSEISRIKLYVEEQDNTLKKITKENSELLSNCVKLQKALQQNEMKIEEIENNKKQLMVELNLTKDREKQVSENFSSSKKQICNIEAELVARNQEKELIENTVTTIREQFNVFKAKYKQLEEDLLDKNKKIFQLQTEKQELFMNNNWKICELEKAKEKDVIINKLKHEVSNYEQKITEYLNELKFLRSDLNEKKVALDFVLEEKQAVVDKNCVEVQKYENALTHYKHMVVGYESQINSLQKNLNESTSNITELQDTIKILKDETNNRDSRLIETQSKCAALEDNLELVREALVNTNNKLNLDIFKIFENVQKMGGLRSTERCESNGSKLIQIENIAAVIKKYNIFLQQATSAPSKVENVNIHTNRSKTIHKLKDEVGLKLLKIEDRIQILQKRNEDCLKMLTEISQIKEKSENQENERIKELSILLQVKELELKEKQKKYEINNRTLLRKVKEHMKGRNSAEKHNKYLQELYNSLSDAHNSLKLSYYSKQFEIENDSKLVENYNNNVLKNSALVSDDDSKNMNCPNCIDCEVIKKKSILLEECVKKIDEEKASIQKALMAKDDVIINLQKEIQDLLLAVSSLKSDNSNCATKVEELLRDKASLMHIINNMEEDLKQSKINAEELCTVLEKEKQNCLESVNENNLLTKDLRELEDKIKYMENETRILHSTLQSKAEDLRQSENDKLKMGDMYDKKEKDSQKLIEESKNNLHDLQNEFSSVNSEKFFLQRLCNDLKLALRAHLNSNKILKKQLDLSKEKTDFKSLPNVLPDPLILNKYDENYINNLLQQNKAPVQDKPVIEIRSCLDALRMEILALQKEVINKNVHTS